MGVGIEELDILIGQADTELHTSMLPAVGVRYDQNVGLRAHLAHRSRSSTLFIKADVTVLTTLFRRSANSPAARGFGATRSPAWQSLGHFLQEVAVDHQPQVQPLVPSSVEGNQDPVAGVTDDLAFSQDGVPHSAPSSKWP